MALGPERGVQPPKQWAGIPSAKSDKLDYEPTRMAVINSIHQALEILALSAESLRPLSFDAATAGPLLDLAALATLRNRLGKKRPAFLGFIGCSGTGKSTICNSLLGEDLCYTGWRAHNTTGPVVIGPSSFFAQLQDLERLMAPLFFPSYKRESMSRGQAQPEKGHPDVMRWVSWNDPAWENLVIFDLPDINTTLAWEENLVALALQPWLDLVVFVVDEETLYHRGYEPPVNMAKQLNQRRICVLNNRGRDRVDLNHPDLLAAREFFGVESIQVLPLIQPGAFFRREPEFLRLKELIQKSAPYHAPVRPLAGRAATLARALLEENERRTQILLDLEERVSQEVQAAVSRYKPIPINRILSEEANQVLEHLGLKRFTISNLYNFLRRAAATGALQRNFQLAFGNNRDKVVSQLLHLDLEKLHHEVTGRLSDRWEAVSHVLRGHPDARLLWDLIPELKSMAGAPCRLPGDALDERVRRFERQCRELIETDSLSSSVLNDPLMVFAVVLILLADVWTIPGFGSWVIVPSVFQYLPLGKFETVKRDFQHALRDLIRDTLAQRSAGVQSARRRVVLGESDPLLAALRTCADYHED